MRGPPFTDDECALVVNEALSVPAVADRTGRNPEVIRRARGRLVPGWACPVVYTVCRVCDRPICGSVSNPRVVHARCWQTRGRYYTGPRLERERQIVARGGDRPKRTLPPALRAAAQFASAQRRQVAALKPPFCCTNCGAAGKHAACGLCWPCYQRQRRAAQRQSPAAPRPVERSEG